MEKVVIRKVSPTCNNLTKVMDLLQCTVTTTLISHSSDSGSDITSDSDVDEHVGKFSKRASRRNALAKLPPLFKCVQSFHNITAQGSNGLYKCIYPKCFVLKVVTILLFLITARKRSLRRSCFYTCLSLILFTGGST